MEENSYQVCTVFQRLLGHGRIANKLLQSLKEELQEIFKTERSLAQAVKSDDHSAVLAGQMVSQRGLKPSMNCYQKLIDDVFMVGCQRYIDSFVEIYNGESSARYWDNNRDRLCIDPIWVNYSKAGDYNPYHIHSGVLSGVLFVNVPKQIMGAGNRNGGGLLNLYGPESFDPPTLRGEMIQVIAPNEGEFVVFPAWQPHSVHPFDGKGHRISVSFNAFLK